MVVKKQRSMLVGCMGKEEGKRILAIMEVVLASAEEEEEVEVIEGGVAAVVEGLTSVLVVNMIKASRDSRWGDFHSLSQVLSLLQGLQQFPAPGGAMRGMGGNRYNPLSRGNAAGPKFPSNNSGGGASWAPPLPHGRAKGQGPFPRGGGAGPRGAFNRGGGGGMGMGGPMGRGSRGGFQGYEPWS